jgi:hypothetical protein
MDWIEEIEKHAGALGRPTIFKDAMTTLSFRLEESLKEDVNLLAEYLERRLESKSSAGAVARAFIASGLEQMRVQYPDLAKFLKQRRAQNNDASKSGKPQKANAKRQGTKLPLTPKAKGGKPQKARAKRQWNGR